MKRQKGQSAVEFALMAPIVFTLILGMIYGGVMFMDYLNFNNQARTIAREISIASTKENRDKLFEDYQKGNHDDILAGVYKVSFYAINDNDEDVIVHVDFTRGDSFLMMPKEFGIVYRMKLEDTEDT